MDKKQSNPIRQMAYFSSLGLSIALAIFLGLALGVYLDGKLDTRPIFTLICIAVGIAAGFRNIGHAIRKSRDI
ncbi:MAG: AtpZ/AtpI family protein [Desulfatitalea sp.]|jgi:ATP synthase protein I|nr:AtpZ/AtpI family protein [Desulfatitalea sp.]